MRAGHETPCPGEAGCRDSHLQLSAVGGVGRRLWTAHSRGRWGTRGGGEVTADGPGCWAVGNARVPNSVAMGVQT